MSQINYVYNQCIQELDIIEQSIQEKSEHKRYNLLRKLAYIACYLCKPTWPYFIEELATYTNHLESPWDWQIEELSNVMRLYNACNDDERKSIFNEWREFTLNNTHLKKFAI